MYEASVASHSCTATNAGAGGRGEWGIVNGQQGMVILTSTYKI